MSKVCFDLFMFFAHEVRQKASQGLLLLLTELFVDALGEVEGDLGWVFLVILLAHELVLQELGKGKSLSDFLEVFGVLVELHVVLAVLQHVHEVLNVDLVIDLLKDSLSILIEHPNSQ